MSDFVDLNPVSNEMIPDLMQVPVGDAMDQEGNKILSELAEEREEVAMEGVPFSRGEEDTRFDLRVARPQAVDLRKLWDLTGQPVPPEISAALGPRVPILLSHVLTPFPPNGRSPGGVWGLGYEIVVNGIEANTQSVVPNDEVVTAVTVNNETQLGLGLGGGLKIPDQVIKTLQQAPSISLTGAEVTATTNWNFQFAVKLAITFRKVLGAPVGVGGAKWQMFRQDEPLDKPHALLQTILVEEGTKSIPCTIKTWAKQAGWLGTGWGAKFFPYPDTDFTISLAND
jgi:hypothetical protein